MYKRSYDFPDEKTFNLALAQVTTEEGSPVRSYFTRDRPVHIHAVYNADTLVSESILYKGFHVDTVEYVENPVFPEYLVVPETPHTVWA